MTPAASEEGKVPKREVVPGDDLVAPGFVRLQVTVAFDGTHYYGWQLQPKDVSVQLRLEEALARLFPSAPRVHSSSRTDTGVHALGMVAHFDVPKSEFRMTPDKLVLAANAHLPPDVRVLAAKRSRPGFHARFSARGKQYRYQVWNHSAHHPLLMTQSWHFPRPLDLAAMRRAAATLVGRHDFRAFSATPGYARRNTVRTVTRCDVRRSGSLITVVIEADGFLYKMCRGIVGTLVQVGVGRFPPEAILPMIESKDRSLAGMTAPAQGLALWKVYYPAKPEPKRHVPAALSEPGADDEE
jgi:tRNA pseudouridine38-40 synthase